MKGQGQGMEFQSKYESPWTDPELSFVVKTGEWRYQRPVTKKGKCCQCGWCYIYCPTGSIVNRGSYFEASLEYCKGCGICVRECPTKAITGDKDVVHVIEQEKCVKCGICLDVCSEHFSAVVKIPSKSVPSPLPLGTKVMHER